MRLNFGIYRLLTLAVLIALFYLLDGFTPPAIDEGAFQAPRMHRIWVFCVSVYLTGACLASFIDHTIGKSRPINIRPAYITIGAIFMAMSLYWLLHLQHSLG